MSYIPKCYISKPIIEHRWVKISQQKNKYTIWVYKNQMKEDKNFNKMFRGDRRWSHEVNLAYVTGSEVYDSNLSMLKSYLLDLYYVINQYLTDADMARIFSHVFGGTKNKWQQWLSCDMILADRFSEHHITTIKCFRLILKSPHLKLMRNQLSQRWTKEKRISLSEVVNVINV